MPKIEIFGVLDATRQINSNPVCDLVTCRLPPVLPSIGLDYLYFFKDINEVTCLCQVAVMLIILHVELTKVDVRITV